MLSAGWPGRLCRIAAFQSKEIDDFIDATGLGPSAKTETSGLTRLQQQDAFICKANGKVQETSPSYKLYHTTRRPYNLYGHLVLPLISLSESIIDGVYRMNCIEGILGDPAALQSMLRWPHTGCRWLIESVHSVYFSNLRQPNIVLSQQSAAATSGHGKTMFTFSKSSLYKPVGNYHYPAPSNGRPSGRAT